MRLYTIARLVIASVFLNAGVVYSTAAEDMNTIRQRLTDEYMPSLTDAAVSEMATIMPLYDVISGAFLDLVYVDNYWEESSPFLTHISRTGKMVTAYWMDVVGNTYYQDPTHADNIERSLFFLALTAPLNEDPSWWATKVTIPRDLMQPLYLSREWVNQTIINNMIDRYWTQTDQWDILDTSGDMAGHNFAIRARYALWGQLLESDAAFQSVYDEFTVILTQELENMTGYNEAGLQADFCLHQHNMDDGTGFKIHQEYNAVYDGLLSEISSIAVSLKNTSFAMSQLSVENLINGLLDCHQWFMWNEASEPTTAGRKVAVDAQLTLYTARTAKETAERMVDFGYRSEEQQRIINRYGLEQPAVADALVGNRAFFRSAMMVHRRETYMCAVRFISDTVMRPETWVLVGEHQINLNNLGYYMGDGFTTCLQHGHELGTINDEIYKYFDFEKCPGTTIEQTGSIPSYNNNNANIPHCINSSPFAGGVSDGTYGAAAMVFDRPTLNFTANKAWGYFNSEFVAVGCDIKPRDGTTLTNPLYTTLNQIENFGDVVYKDASGNTQTLTNGQVNLANPPQWLFHDRILYIPISLSTADPSWTINVDNRTYQTSTKNIFQAYLDHGTPTETNPANYAYIIRPDIDLVDVDNYIATGVTNKILVTHYTPEKITIINKVDRVGYGIFFEAASAWSAFMKLQVDQPCLVYYREGPKINNVRDVTIGVSSPGNPDLEVIVRVSKVLEGPNSYIDDGKTFITFNLPGGDYTGQTVVQEYTFTK